MIVKMDAVTALENIFACCDVEAAGGKRFIEMLAECGYHLTPIQPVQGELRETLGTAVLNELTNGATVTADQLTSHMDTTRRIVKQIGIILAAQGLRVVPMGPSAEFKRQRHGAVVATIRETGAEAVEVIATEKGDYELVVHVQREDRSYSDDLTVRLRAEDFERLGSIAAHMRARRTTEPGRKP